ncbi:hypothetical protein M8C21_009486 [Ambrosia artemisiifolia]|uniref:Uncharacterized protein n=1 Tax=Ambrosia artemisiifolia TaxID=4212 RepID=A0AAD5BUH1_AMBAR|nr:hypothetical protein M8C21_009486 [Ambrosia artemisiifolia]
MKIPVARSNGYDGIIFPNLNLNFKNLKACLCILTLTHDSLKGWSTSFKVRNGDYIYTYASGRCNLNDNQSSAPIHGIYMHQEIFPSSDPRSHHKYMCKQKYL